MYCTLNFMIKLNFKIMDTPLLPLHEVELLGEVRYAAYAH